MPTPDFTPQSIKEEWRPVVGYEDLYEVSSQGRVRSLPVAGTRRGNVLTAHPHYKWGYYQVKLLRDGHSKTVTVHRLVGSAFIGPIPDGLETRHLDDDKSHNHVGNLTYGTKSENAQDRIRNGHHENVNKTHCPQGHSYSAENTGISPKRGCRYCKTCKREKIRAWRQRQLA